MPVGLIFIYCLFLFLSSKHCVLLRVLSTFLRWPPRCWMVCPPFSLSPNFSPRLSPSFSSFLFPFVRWCLSPFLFPFDGWFACLPTCLPACLPASSSLSPSLSPSLSLFCFPWDRWSHFALLADDLQILNAHYHCEIANLYAA